VCVTVEAAREGACVPARKIVVPTLRFRHRCAVLLSRPAALQARGLWARRHDGTLSRSSR
jgi:hypothetical protein